MKNSLIRTGAALTRPGIAFFAACSGLTGYLLITPGSAAKAPLLFAAVFLLASGASALNQFQERRIDGLMKRTRNRPLPSGTLRPGTGLLASLILIASGLSLIAPFGTLPLFLGLFALVWYNAVYTPLKRVTAFAAVPGALVGAIPPALGWTAAGGTPADPRLLALGAVFFLWQVPHFWLQTLDHGKEYEQAGLPCLTGLLSRAQIARITFIWICAAAVSGLFLPLFGAVRSPLLSFLLVPAAAGIVAPGIRLLAGLTASAPRSAFRMMNVYLAVVMALLCSDSVLRTGPGATLAGSGREQTVAVNETPFSASRVLGPEYRRAAP